MLGTPSILGLIATNHQVRAQAKHPDETAWIFPRHWSHRGSYIHPSIYAERNDDRPESLISDSQKMRRALFRTADRLYQEMPQATRDKWRAAIKHKCKSPYDLWMSECLTLFYRGQFPPDAPSHSGGFNPRNAKQGSQYVFIDPWNGAWVTRIAFHLLPDDPRYPEYLNTQLEVTFKTPRDYYVGELARVVVYYSWTARPNYWHQSRVFYPPDPPTQNVKWLRTVPYLSVAYFVHFHGPQLHHAHYIGSLTAPKWWIRTKPAEPAWMGPPPFELPDQPAPDHDHIYLVNVCKPKPSPPSP